MTVKVRQRPGRRGFEVDLHVRLPDGELVRERVQSPVSTYSASLRWAQQREALILAQGGKAKEQEEESEAVPTFAEFHGRFLEEHARANREKPSSIETRERLWRLHLAPAVGGLHLDQITNQHVQRLKARLAELSPKSANNILAELSGMLRAAVRWGVIADMPCRVDFLAAPKPIVEHYEDSELDRLVCAAKALDARAHVVVLLGADAGLRVGEIIGLEWPDFDLGRGLLKVRRSIWKGIESLPKGGKPRVVPTTSRLREALAAHRHSRGERVLCTEDGAPLSRFQVRELLDAAERRAGLQRGGRVHILRHTFCSRLAARGVPLPTVKELAGHAAIETTLRYVHLAATAPREGIAALEAPEQSRGAMAEQVIPLVTNARKIA